jgi:hypothetical protein
MKIAASDNRIERSGIENQTAFSIKASGKAFKILSDGLYSNKIAAVVRELSCNAYDAHIAANKKHVPIELHIPTHIESWFSVKDHGIGLSHEDVIHLYSTYFESTKNTSNDFVGAFGLGSKSPFSYVDTFSVVSWFDGVKRSYTSYITEDGTPNISLIHTEETSEENGIEVQVPVKERDINSFAEEVQKCLKHFDPLPQTNFPDFDWNLKEIISRGEDWIYYGSGGGYYNDRGVKAVQGQVAYKIDTGAFGSQLISDKARFILDSFNMSVTFDIGQLEVAASRESLSYNKQTVTNIIKKLERIYDSFEVDFMKRINSFQGTGWERAIFLKNLRRENSDAYVEFTKNKIHSHILFDFSTMPDVVFEHKTSQSRRKNRFVEHSIKEATMNIQPEENVKVFVRDAQVPMTWISHHFDTNQMSWENSQILIISSPTTPYKDVIAALGNPSYTKTSSLAKPPRRPRLSSPPQVIKTVLKDYKDRGQHEFKGELPEKGYYVSVERGRVTRNGERFEELDEVVKKAIDYEWLDVTEHPHVFCLTKKQQKEIKDNTDWVELFAYVEGKLVDWYAKNAEKYFMYQEFNNSRISYYTKRMYAELNQLLDKNLKDSVLGVSLKRFDEYSKVTVDSGKARLASIFNYTPVINNVKLPKLSTINEDMIAEYPMLKHAINNGVESSEIPALLDYVKLVENSKLTKKK